MKILKSHFWFNKSQRNGVFFLLLIIVLLQIGFFFVDSFIYKKNNLSSKEIKNYEKKIDSLKKIELEKRAPKTYLFNPNFITDYKGYQLGMSINEIDRLHKYREEGNYINSIKQFKEITKVSDSLLKNISPYFKFPKWISSKKNRQKIKFKKSTEKIIVKRDLNLANVSDFKSIKGIGDKLAERIIKYRTKLQGFSLNEQLFEVWYLDKDVAALVLQHFEVLTIPEIKKININQATFKQVLSIAYIDYELAKKIFNYRDEVAEIQSVEELKKIDDFPLEKFNRIALYLEAK